MLVLGLSLSRLNNSACSWTCRLRDVVNKDDVAWVLVLDASKCSKLRLSCNISLFHSEVEVDCPLWLLPKFLSWKPSLVGSIFTYFLVSTVQNLSSFERPYSNSCDQFLMLVTSAPNPTPEPAEHNVRRSKVHGNAFRRPRK